MDGQLLFNIVVGVAGALAGFLLNAVWTALKDLQVADKQIVKDVSELQVLVAGQYVTRTEFDRVAEALFRKLDAIYDKLDSKADKASCPPANHGN